MAEENKDSKNFPPPLPGLGSSPSPSSSSFPGLPFLPPDILQSAAGQPTLPGLPPLKNSTLPPTPGFGGAPQKTAPASNADKENMEKKLSELEKKLQEEREKVLMSQLKNQQEAVTAAKVESSLKELQDKIRRERRDQESEESRLRLENKLREMEGRLAQERETWVATLKSQMQTRESQDKDIESHFVARIQEMERRWLDEKTQWQKVVSAKDEEVRNWKAVAEKLRNSEAELGKIIVEKKWTDERLRELEKKAVEAETREKELVQLRTEISLLKENARKESETSISAARAHEERERRLANEIEELRKDRDSIAARISQEKDFELQRAKAALRALHSEIEAREDAERKLSSEVARLKAELGQVTDKISAQKDAEIRQLKSSFELQMETLRITAKAREEKLAAEMEGLKKENSRLIEKYEAAREFEARKLKLEAEVEIKRYQEKIRQEEEQKIHRRVAAEVFAATKALEEKNKATMNAETQRIKLAAIAEIKKYHRQMEEAGNRISETDGELQKTKMLAQALEKQVSELKLRLSSAQAQKVQSLKKEENMRAALAAMRSQWEEREREISDQAQARALEVIEVEKNKLINNFQKELAQRDATRENIKQEKSPLEESTALKQKNELERLCSAQSAQLLLLKKEIDSLKNALHDKTNISRNPEQ